MKSTQNKIILIQQYLSTANHKKKRVYNIKESENSTNKMKCFGKKIRGRTRKYVAILTNVDVPAFEYIVYVAVVERPLLH